jgi:hypothetical protein
MDHADHVALIRGGLDGAGARWLELGAGSGAFTLALVDVLGDDAQVAAVDVTPACSGSWSRQWQAASRRVRSARWSPISRSRCRSIPPRSTAC